MKKHYRLRWWIKQFEYTCAKNQQTVHQQGDADEKPDGNRITTSHCFPPGCRSAQSAYQNKTFTTTKPMATTPAQKIGRRYRETPCSDGIVVAPYTSPTRSDSGFGV